MRIGFVTPFNERSAIGRVSAATARTLVGRGHEVLIVRSELDPQGSPALTANFPIASWVDLPPKALEQRCDVVVVAVGDYYDYHAGIFPYLDQLSCVGIFHDFYLYGLFHGWLAAHGGGDALHDREIGRVYGEHVLDFARRARRGEASLEEIARTIPMTGWLGSRCGGALTHAHFYRDSVQADCPGPVHVAQLCQEPVMIKELSRTDHSDVTVTTVGRVNPNKCADLVIRAIGTSETLRSRCTYRLAGHISPEQRTDLSALANKVGTRLEILGELSAEALHDELERADIFCCLRRPVLEGASASAIEAMMAGRPVVVLDAGFYAELPDEFVCKVPTDVDESGLASVLERLTADETLRRDLGRKTREFAQRTFTPDRYVDRLERLINEFILVKPSLAVANRMGDELHRLGINSEFSAVVRIGTTLQDLFGQIGSHT